jgi:hypothetical protein
MSDEDTLYVLGHTLSHIDRGEVNPNTGEPTAWMPIWNAQVKRIQYDDISMPHMIQMVWKVLSENLQSFFSEFQSSLSESASTPSATSPSG